MNALRQRFEAKFLPEPMSGCWLWNGATNAKGYGRFAFNKRNALAHRISWIIYRGDIPEGLCVCHRCDTPPCVNPDHLFLGTLSDNYIDALLKGSRPNAKLTVNNAIAILTDNRSLEQIAESYGVHRTTIGEIKRGHSWVRISGAQP